MTTYNKLIILCNKNDISINLLCKHLGIKITEINNMKKGIKPPSQESLNKICDFFHISRDYFNPEIEDEFLKAQYELNKKIKLELFGTTKVPDEVFSVVKDFAKFFYERYNKELESQKENSRKSSNQ